MSGTGKSQGTGAAKGHGLQVLRVVEGSENRYHLELEALEGLLLRDDVRDRPVVVISVAGSYRGGKSFLLDFFLRYLSASRASQVNGEWLGNENEPLKGFGWRGGCERETTGIHFWSEPFHVKLDYSGQEVVVLLMDTQGTFDSESTIQDSSTIFAMSTLTSSVQIYNLFRNIQEDDLQHLHLFTDYGTLVSDGGDGKAFQVLQFLVRDWPHAHEHTHGYVGGNALLTKRLEMKPGQKQELREVREHIRSCFDKITCFLMPHPGLKVENATFDGCLTDISERFRMALLELVPSLFDPSNLIPKVIGGRQVKGRDLVLYFQKYIELFNSDEMPPAVSILKGTAAACMMAAMSDGRDAYDEHMERSTSHTHSCTAAAVTAKHEAARDAAIQLFHGKRKLGSKEDAEGFLDQLNKELDARLPLYLWQNEAKVRDDLAAARRVYNDAVLAVCDAQQLLCLHPLDLDELHHDSMSAAVGTFSSTRILAENEEDEDRQGFEKQLAEEYVHLCALNEQNNSTAVVEAREVYISMLKSSLPYQSGVSTEKLKEFHDKSFAAAMEKFKTKRNRETEQEEDPYMLKLIEQIDDQWVEVERQNMTSNKMAMQAAEYTYNSHVSSAWGPQGCCFHPEALVALHRAAADAALADFQQNRDKSENDDYKEKLVKLLQKRYTELKQVNEYNNNQAVQFAFGEYTRRMDKHCAPSLSSILIGPFIVKLLVALPHHHERGKNDAISLFKKKRRGPTHSNDAYLDNLKQMMEEAYVTYRNPFVAILRELGLPLPN